MKYGESQPTTEFKDSTFKYLKFCCNELKMKEPCVKFINKQDTNTIVEWQVDVNGLAAPLTGNDGTIFINIEMEYWRLFHTVAHECWHIYEYKVSVTVPEIKVFEYRAQLYSSQAYERFHSPLIDKV